MMRKGRPGRAVPAQRAIPTPPVTVVGGLLNLAFGLLAPLAVLVLLTSCASSEQAVAGRDAGARGAAEPGTGARPPAWVTDPPADSASTVYFTASASAPDKGVPELRQEATGTLIDEIVRYLGVRVTVETTARARASLEEFETEVTREVRQQSEARLAGFRVEDTYVAREPDRTTVYLLASFDRGALEAEKRRLERLFRERVEEVEAPLAEAGREERAGNYVAALRLYLEAAAAAADSEIDNARLKLRESLEAARGIAEKLQLEAVGGPSSAQLGEPFGEPFVGRLVFGTAGAGVPGAPVEVSYRMRRPNGRTVVAAQTLQTDDSGTVRFTPPPPNVVGNQSLHMRLELSEYLEPLRGLRGGADDLMDSLQRTFARARTSFPYEVISTARSVPTGVVVLETDVAGNPTGRSDVSKGITETLTQAGFSVRVLSVEASQLQQLSEPDWLGMLRSAVGDKVERVVYGTVSIDDFSEEDGYLVKVSGSVQAVELETGTTLYATSALQYSRAKSANGAITAAFHSVGNKLGEELINNLP